MIYVKRVQFYKQLKLIKKYWEMFGQNCPKIEDAVKLRGLRILRKNVTRSLLAYFIYYGTTFHSNPRRWVNQPSEMAWIDP